MAVSQNLAKSILESIVGGKTYTPPANWYLGLSASPIENGVIPNNAEPLDGTGYARKTIPNTQLQGANNGSFQPAQSDAAHPLAYVTNAQTITMDEIISGAEPTVQYFFLSENAGNSGVTGDYTCSMWGTFDRARKLAINSNLIIESGGAVFEMVNVD